jgi:hypothetical protein
LWLIRGPSEEPFFAFATNGPAATKAAAQAATGCGSEVTASQVNRLWESFQAQGLTELSRLPSVYLSLPGYPILPGQASVGLTCSYHTRGLCVRGFQHLVDAINYGMLLMYIGQKTPNFPLTDHTPSKHERNRRIRARYAKGETVVSLAEVFGISQQRVSQILRGKRK